jgi:hypothetical protein
MTKKKLGGGFVPPTLTSKKPLKKGLKPPKPPSKPPKKK